MDLIEVCLPQCTLEIRRPRKLSLESPSTLKFDKDQAAVDFVWFSPRVSVLQMLCVHG